MKRLVIKPLARENLRAASRWYNDQRSGLGKEFLESADELFERLKRRPELYAELGQGVRQARLLRFPYNVYYRIRGEQAIVLTILHSKRDPDKWRLST